MLTCLSRASHGTVMLTYVMLTYCADVFLQGQSWDSDADVCDADHIVLTCFSRPSDGTVMLAYVMLTILC